MISDNNTNLNLSYYPPNPCLLLLPRSLILSLFEYCPCMCLSLPTDSRCLVDRAVLPNNATLSMHALYPLAVYVLWINLCFLTVQHHPYTLSNIDCPYLVDLCYQTNPGAGVAQWLEHRTHDRKVTGSNPCRSGGRIFFSRVNFVC